MFVGSNSTLVAPVEIGAGAYLAAGSVITDPVPPDALALGPGAAGGQGRLGPEAEGKGARQSMSAAKIRMAANPHPTTPAA